MTEIERQILKNQLILIEIADAEMVDRLGRAVAWGAFRADLADRMEETRAMLDAPKDRNKRFT